MQITQRSVLFVAVLQVLVFSTILCSKIDGGRKKRRLTEDDYNVQQLFGASSGILAGAETPVWIAELASDEETVLYRNAKYLPGGGLVVGDAVHYYKYDKYKGVLSKKRRSVDENNEDNIKNLDDLVHDTFATSSVVNVSEKYVEKRDTNDEVYHPTLLMVMDFELDELDMSSGDPKPLYERILYALAFTNAVDLQFRHVKNPYVRLRLGGIIIPKNKAAVPYLRQHENWLGLDYKGAFTTTLKHFQHLATFDSDFRIGAYDILVVMSDSKPAFSLIKSTHGVSSLHTSCLGRNKEIAVSLFHDDHMFGGIQTAVHELTHVISLYHHDGDTDRCPLETGMVMSPSVNRMGRTFSRCTLDSFTTTLKVEGRCLKEAKEVHPPGNPVDLILPGKLMPAAEQCRHRFGYTDPYVCWESTGCTYLQCANNNSMSSCQNWGPVLDGTTCDPGKMCLDGKCVKNTIALT